ERCAANAWIASARGSTRISRAGRPADRRSAPPRSHRPRPPHEHRSRQSDVVHAIFTGPAGRTPSNRANQAFVRSPSRHGFWVRCGGCRGASSMRRAWTLALVCLATALVGITTSCPPSLPAFPGAEGPGASALGGRRGVVLFVDNLADHGPGS